MSTEYEVAEWAYLVHPQDNAAITADSLACARDVVSYAVNHLGPAGILVYAPDILVLKIAKATLLLVKVSLIVYTEQRTARLKSRACEQKLPSLEYPTAKAIQQLISELGTIYDRIGTTNCLTESIGPFFVNAANAAARCVPGDPADPENINNGNNNTAMWSIWPSYAGTPREPIEGDEGMGMGMGRGGVIDPDPKVWEEILRDLEQW